MVICGAVLRLLQENKEYLIHWRVADNHMLLLGQAAGSAFNILFKGGAGSAVDSVIPALLAGLEGDPKQASQALEGLRVILGVRPQTLSSMVRGSACCRCASSC